MTRSKTTDTVRRSATKAAAKPKAETPKKTVPAVAAKSFPPAQSQPMLRKKQLVDEVAAASGVKRGDTKAVIEAALQILGEALSADKKLQLPPLGTAIVNRRKDVTNGETLIVKLRRRNATPPLAKPE